MNAPQMTMRINALSNQIHQTERVIDTRRAQRDMAQNTVNGVKNFLTTVPPNHPRAMQAKVKLVQAENLMREAGVRIQNGERMLQSLMLQRSQVQQQLERVQAQIQQVQQRNMQMMAARSRGQGQMRRW